MTTVTFELYNEDMFFELAIETADPEAVVAALAGMSNVRNISY